MTGRIPVTILSGYLGAGKTTILNQTLAANDGMRLAVLVNDFGPINIDAALVRKRGRDVIELSNGCVCCSIGDNLGEVLSAIANRPERPDRVLIEASGVAEPSRLALAAGHWPNFELDAILVAADAETIRARATDKFVGPLVRSQLESADIVLLTKTDLAEPEAADATEVWLQCNGRSVRVVRVDNGRVPLAILFSSSLAELSRRAYGQPVAQHEFVKRIWRPDGPVDIAKLVASFEMLPDCVHRAKGFVVDGDAGRSVLIQCVGKRFSLTAASDASEEEHGIVFISVADGHELETFCAGLDQWVI